ncbi:hypothetical protein [Micromonospora sp. NPDC048843]|uniref:hypothetical protein n=1 Tax=Micromonospora sp. NPDC048843 TaxID=3155389 RepID=UPI0033F60F55
MIEDGIEARPHRRTPNSDCGAGHIIAAALLGRLAVGVEESGDGTSQRAADRGAPLPTITEIALVAQERTKEPRRDLREQP